MMEALWRDYLKLMEDLGRTIEKLSSLEQEKTMAVSNHDVDGVDACMKQEQALSLSLRGLDQKREKLLRQLGLEGVTLRDLPARAPDELFMEVKAAAEKLRSRYNVFQGTSQLARDTLECHLRAIEKASELPPEEDRPSQADFRI